MILGEKKKKQMNQQVKNIKNCRAKIFLLLLTESRIVLKNIDWNNIVIKENSIDESDCMYSITDGSFIIKKKVFKASENVLELVRQFCAKDERLYMGSCFERYIALITRQVLDKEYTLDDFKTIMQKNLDEQFEKKYQEFIKKQKRRNTPRTKISSKSYKETERSYFVRQLTE